MAKRHNTNTLFSNAIQEDAASEAAQSSLSAVESIDIDSLKSEIVRLQQENQDLTDRISQYIEDIEELKNTSEDDNEIMQLKKQISELQVENDNYLMKISDLTFENAKLNSQVEELTQKDNTNSNQNTNTKQSINVSYNNVHAICNDLYKNNGYSDWN